MRKTTRFFAKRLWIASDRRLHQRTVGPDGRAPHSGWSIGSRNATSAPRISSRKASLPGRRSMAMLEDLEYRKKALDLANFRAKLVEEYPSRRKPKAISTRARSRTSPRADSSSVTMAPACSAKRISCGSQCAFSGSSESRFR